MDFPLFVDLPVASALLVIALASGALSLGVLGKEPAGGSAAMSSLALEASGLSKAYKIGKTRQQVLKNVDFTAYHGQMTMVMGPSGSGKSTLIAALSGLMRPDEGKVMAMGESLWAKSDGKIDKFRLKHCGFIFQRLQPFSRRWTRSHRLRKYFDTAASASANREGAPSRCWNRSAWAGVCIKSLPNCRAGKSSGWPSRARWPRLPRVDFCRRTYLGTRFGPMDKSSSSYCIRPRKSGVQRLSW